MSELKAEVGEQIRRSVQYNDSGRRMLGTGGRVRDEYVAELKLVAVGCYYDANEAREMLLREMTTAINGLFDA